MNRRAFIKTLGGTGLVVAASAVGLSQCDQMPDIAIAPWQGPNSDISDKEWILSYALLAPNPHNMQAWIADIREENVISLIADGERLLPDTDPYSRQVIIGQGTFLELLNLAALEKGYSPTIKLFPEGAPPVDQLDISGTVVARIKLGEKATTTKDPLFQQILKRRSNKEAYTQTALSDAHKSEIESLALRDQQSLKLVTNASEMEIYRPIARKAILLEMETPRTLRESVVRTRIGADEIAKHRDGIDLNGPMFWWLKFFGVMTEENAMTPGTMAYQGGIDYALGWTKDTYSMGMLISKDNSRHSQVEAGRTYVRLNLLATQLGVAMHPVSQVLQEYPEMAELQKEFNAHVGVKGTERVQMFFRLGYQKNPAPSPRRALTDIVRA